MNGAAHGAGLLAAVVAEHVGALDDEQREELPPPAPRHRPPRAHRAAHRACATGSRPTCTASTGRGTACSRRTGVLVVELDVHGAAVPQVIGAIMAAGCDGLERRAARRCARSRPRAAARGDPRAVPGAPAPRRGPDACGRRVRASARSPMRAARPTPARGSGVPAERRWAMEVLGLGAGMARRPARRAAAVPPAAPPRAPRPRGRRRRRGRAHRGAHRGPRAAPRGPPEEDATV